MSKVFTRNVCEYSETAEKRRGSYTCMVCSGLKGCSICQSFSFWLFVCNCFSLLQGARRSNEEIKFGTALPPPLGINAPTAQFAGLVSKTEGGTVFLPCAFFIWTCDVSRLNLRECVVSLIFVVLFTKRKKVFANQAGAIK